MDVFVYGSLMAGEHNHGVIAGAAYLGPGRTAPRFELVDLGPYPGLIAPGATQVTGELYRVDAALLARLDEFEGHPGLYRRRTIALADGGRAEAYLLSASQGGALPRIASGDWRAHRRARGAAG